MWITEENRKWWILAAMTTSISMIFVDITVLPVALPTLQRELNISELGLQWTVNAYTLVLAVLVLAGGRIGDMWGLKKSFCFGISLFAFASALCGLSFSPWWLIFSRCLQGIGGAFLIPATQGTIVTHFPPHQRGKAVGLFVSIGSIFLSLGPLIGGSLTTYLSWRYVFWINIPIAAIGLTMTLITVPPMHGKKESFDYRGFFIMSTGICSLVVALMQAQEWGWTSFRTLFLLILGLFFLYYLFKRKHKPHASIIDFNMIRTKTFISSCSCIFSTAFMLMVTVFWAIYFQNIMGYSASAAGFYAFIANAPILIAAPLAGFLVDRYGPRLPVMMGFSLMVFAFAWLLKFYRHESILLLLPTLIPFGIGTPLIFTPSFVSMMNEVPSDKRGIASGINATLRQFSSTVGLAVFGTVFSSTQLTQLTQYLHSNPATYTLSPKLFEGLLAHTPDAVKAASSLPASETAYIIQSSKTAFLDAFFRINLLSGCVAVLGIFIAFKLMKNHPIHKEIK